MSVAALLRANRHFAAVEPEHLDTLAAGFAVTRLPAGHTVFAEGDHADGIYLVVSGEVGVTRREGEHRYELTRHGPGALFGLLSMLLDTRRSATCVTTTPTEVAQLNRSGALLVFHQSAPVAYAFQTALATQLARDLRAADERLRQLIARARAASAPG